MAASELAPGAGPRTCPAWSTSTSPRRPRRQSGRPLAEQERTRAALLSRRRTRVIAVALALALLASLSAGVVAVKQARSANAAATAANAGRIGALAKDPAVPIDQALLLGAQAEALDAGVPEDSNLLAALARSPSLAAAARSPSRVLSLVGQPRRVAAW